MNPEQLDDVVDTLRAAYAAKLIRGEHPSSISISHKAFGHEFFLYGREDSLSHTVRFRTRFVVVRGGSMQFGSPRSEGTLEPDALGRETFRSVVAEFVRAA